MKLRLAKPALFPRNKFRGYHCLVLLRRTARKRHRHVHWIISGMDAGSPRQGQDRLSRGRLSRGRSGFLRAALGLLVLGLSLGAVTVGAAEPREVAVVVDTSGSMGSNDRERYTLQVARLLADLASDGDGLTVLRMPHRGDCGDGADHRLARRLDTVNRPAFKAELDGFLAFNTGTYLAAPIRTAIEVLEGAPDRRRLLLVIADSDGLGSCGADLTRELTALRSSGAHVAAINLGGDAFRGSTAFDSTFGARDARQLIRAVSEVYQQFLGAKRVQTGDVHGGRIEAHIAPHVGTAYLVTVADGQAGSVAVEGGPPGAGPPGAEALDLDVRGGGSTVGLDGVRRSYRIVRLERPRSGAWSFAVAGLGSSRAGWMLLQDSVIGIRSVSSEPWLVGQKGRLEVELFDLDTGKALRNPEHLPGLGMEAVIDGRTVRLVDDGHGPDRVAGDGIFSAETEPLESLGAGRVSIRVGSEVIDKSFSLRTEVVAGRWRVEVELPERLDLRVPFTARARLRPEGDPDPAPPSLRLEGLGVPVELSTVEEGVYVGVIQPTEIGTFPVEVDGPGSVSPWRGQVEVVGKLVWAEAPPVSFGSVAAEQVARARLDLTASQVAGAYEVLLTTDFRAERSTLSIDTGEGFRALDGAGVTLQIDESRLEFPLRLDVSSCPEAVPADPRHHLILRGKGADGLPFERRVPLDVRVIPEPWLVCWWPALAAGLGILATVVGFHGWLTPARFPSRAGLVLSPELDITEGFFHPFRAQKGSASGFYRDARLFLHGDFRLSRSASGALARLRAGPGGIWIRPSSVLWRLGADGEWSPLGSEERRLRSGNLYRDDLESLYFELRNG